jgi:hypothetical protein
VRVIATCTIALTLASSARAADVDWKMCGGATADAQSFCFYDANGVAIVHSGYVRVWTKCMRKADLESVYFKGDRGRQMRRRNLLQQFDPLAADREFESGKPRDVGAWRDSPKTIGLYALSRTRLHRDWQSTVGLLA